MALTAKKVYAILKRQISDMEAKLNSPVRYRGTVATADLLPLNPDIGDMYNIESKSVYGEAGMNVAWNGVVWDTLGPAIDMAPYLREDSEIITSLKTKTENLESANYTDRGTLADTDAFLINDGTGMKKSVLSKLSDFVLNKIADKVFEKLQTNDKTILGAINELNSKALIYTPTISTSVSEYLKTLSERKTHYFRTESGADGNPYKTGSCFFVIYIINRSSDGIGFAINHSSTAYYMRLATGEIHYIALS